MQKESILTLTLSACAGIELHTSSSHGKVQKGQSLELDCVSSGSIDTEDIETISIIYHESESENFDDVTHMRCARNGAECKKTIPSFSASRAGKYFCTVVISDKHFSSKVEAINIDPGKSGLEMSSKILIGFALLLF